MKHMRRTRAIGYTLAHSLYITTAWNWFLEFMGRAAEAVLVISVLYASVKLLPVVHLPAGLDVVIFVAQFVALDVGGLSLGKLARQAQSEGNSVGATQASSMSKALITVMIVGVVVVAIEQLFLLPATWKLSIDTVLLIARSILAVLYGHIIHTLRKEEFFVDEHPHAKGGDMRAQLSWSIMGMAAYLQRKYQQLASHQEKHLDEVQALFEMRLATIVSVQSEMQASLQQRDNTPAIDLEAITRQIEAVNEARFEALSQALPRQQIASTEAHHASKKSHEAKHSASNIVIVKQTGTGTTERRAAIYALLDKGDRRSSYQLAPVIGCSAATIQRYMKEWRAERQKIRSPET